MDILIQAKATQVANMNQNQLEQLKTEMSLSRDLSAVARNYLDIAIEKKRTRT